MPNGSSPDPSTAVAAVLDLLVRQGYETTSVEELADAAGISRSTFFRKYGSNEGMVSQTTIAFSGSSTTM
ncbi:TetR/AcrR family transcriptional regulator [Paenarthrobacter sp. GOM3]|uniref:TetR/AcrR family transcriptional regulator n=1 Tax=Paenarthrobacter sp. GOM3 TaxID=2782567 RepID=UPI00201134D8|nr:TetR/AcrR family transcriptional regulator [Paenarthrobacter sp. GOM3]WOH20549.1 TetR/AcrR family transcriptional regulator [Paenarthrobacter sp. GOM3]